MIRLLLLPKGRHPSCLWFYSQCSVQSLDIMALIKGVINITVEVDMTNHSDTISW
jgi:hypothetical protein